MDEVKTQLDLAAWCWCTITAQSLQGYCTQLYGHNCMATADRAVVVFVKEFQWDQRPQPLQNGLIHHSPKIYFVFKKKNPSNNRGQDATFSNQP